MHTPAVLALEDGLIFEGISIGYHGSSCGEVVFNTAMTGYQEILSDPSYAEQIVTLTYPHIGNTGTNAEDNEAGPVFTKGLVIRDLSSVTSSWRNTSPLSEYLITRKVVGIAELDTRALTHHLRTNGAKRGAIICGENIDKEKAIQMARGARDLKGLDLAKEVTCQSPYRFEDRTWDAEQAGRLPLPKKFRIVVMDYGVKRNILRILVDLGCEVNVLPAQSTLETVLSYQPDGVVLSNGPGDPEPCDYAIQLIRDLMAKHIPIYGICLGHQLLGLAVGARTYKMPFGHHGANHPVMDLQTQKVWTTSQNHGFAIEDENLPSDIIVTHRSLFDQSIQGIRLKNKPAYSFQGHPEASPGPHDALGLFDQFLKDMEHHRAETK